MKSVKPENSEEKIKKVTEFLTKLFRFCFFLIIAPFAISLAGFWILVQFPWASYIAFTISVIIFTFAFLFFYKSFDKYRNNPFFYNKSNNPIARVHIIFLISILSYVVTPIFDLITPKHWSFIYIPLISFSLLYNIVYYYYYFQPIDFFNIGEGEFKHAISLKLMLKQPYNFVIVINYFIQILYLSFITSSDFAWLFGLINNVIFYLITLASVSNQQNEIKKSIEENKPFLKNLTKFKRKFVTSLASFIFVLLIQMPFISLVFLIQRGQFSVNILIDDAFLSFLFLLLFLKTVLYIYLHYEFLFELYKNPETSRNSEEENKDTKVKYQKLSSILTGILILLITLYTFLIELPYITLIILPFFFIFTHYEHKSNYSFKKYNNFIILLYCVACLASISFGILPSISDLINFNIQLIVFSLSFYFILELFRRVDYFKKGNILITQNILALIAFFLIILNYVYISTDPYLTLVSNIFIILIVFFVVLLLSFYRLYAIFFKEKYSKTFKICVLINLFLIELMIFTLINFNIYFTVSFNLFIKLLVISTILFPLIFMLFLSLNYLVGMINLKTLLASIYYSFWSLIVIIFLSILNTFFPNYIVMIFNFLLLLILINFNLKYGAKIEKVKEETYKTVMSVLSYPIFLLLLALIFSIFYASFQFLILIDNLILSSFLTLIITCVLINCIAQIELLFTKAISIKINVITLLLSSIYLFYYLSLLSLNLGTFYLFTFPVIITSSFLYLPIMYSLKKNVAPKLTRTALVYNGIFISIFLTLIPTFIYLELINLGLPVDIITVITDINFTLYILFGILLIYRIRIRENLKRIILIFAVLIAFLLTGSTVFFYFFIIFSETSFRLLLPLIIASSYFFIPTTYSYRKRLIRESIGIKMLTYNSLLLSGLILCVPTFIYLELINLGLPVNDITLITDINFTLYTLFGILIIINFKIRENLKGFILRFKVSITFILTGTTVFFYFFIIFYETSFRFLLPLMLASSYFFIPSTYSYRKRLMKESIGKKILTYNTLLLSGLILCVPTFIYLELINLGLPVNDITLITDINFTLYTLFGILIIINFKIRENLKRFILKLEVLVATLLTGTTVFFYFFIVFCDTLFRFLLPLMLASIYFFIPSTYSYRKGLLKESIGKKSLIYNSILLSGIILCVPTLMGLQIERMGLSVDYILILIFTVFILFIILRIFNSMAENFKLKENYIKVLRFLQIFVWLIFSFLISFEIILLGLAQSLLTIRFLIISCSILTFFIINTYTLKLLQLYSKELTFLRYLKDILYYGLIFSPSLVIFSLIQFSEILKYLPTEMHLFNVFWYLGFFFLITFISFKLSNALIKAEFPKLQRNIEFVSWLIAKVTICFFISFILTYFLSLVQFSVFNLIITFILIVSLLSPITFSYFEKFELVSEEYRFFIKRFTVILFITDILSFISYSWLFNNPIYGQFNLILTATLTLSLTGLAYVLLFYKSRLPLRRISFFIVLPCIVISFPIFLYFFISVSLSIPFGDPFPLIIAIDIGIFLFYLSIGIYHWKFSWAIWRTGWYAWFIVPFANFYLLYRSLKGVDIATSAIDFFGYEINGSFLLTTVIFFLFFLPIAYTKIKIYFYQILLIIWGINLALLYWISQNLFLTNFLLRYLVFALFAAVLLAPLFYKLKFWKTISFVWLILIAINANFLIFFLLSLEIPLDIAISIDIFAIAMLVLILSFFPAFKSIKNLIIIGSYITAIIGIFLTIYFILYHIILDPIFALNITFIFVGFSLFSSKYIKPIKRLTDIISSWILIFGISWLTFNSFNLLPNLLFFAIFLAIAVWGGSFYVFNYYKMKIHIHKIIPFSAVSFGISSAVSSFLAIFLPENPFFIAAIFVMISLLFVYYPLGNYRLYLWYLFPLPLTFLFQELFLMIDFIQSSLFLAILIFLVDYLIMYQLIMNISNSHYEEAKIKGENTLSYFFKDKNQIKLQNLICFIINSIYFSILISVISVNIFKQVLFRDLILVYQILNILIILPFLVLFSIKYIIKSELELKVKNILIYIHKISYFIYLIVPLATAFNLFLLLLKLDVALTNSIYLFLIILSGMLFTELFIFDNRYFYYLFVTTRNKLMFWSWVVFCNTSCIFLYFFHLNEYFLILSVSLVNLIDSYFISYFNIKNENFVSMVHLILFYNSFIWVSFYIASLISNGIVLILEELRGIPSLLLFIQNSIFFLFIFSFFIRKAKEKIKLSIKLLLIALFQIIFAINWVVIFLVFHILNLFTVYSIILIETCLLFITVKFMDILFIKEKFPNFLTKSNSLIIFLLYLETSVMIYGLAIEFLGFFESIFISQLTLFILTSFDIYFLKKIRESYGRLVHTISYFILSLSTLLILNQFVKFNPLLISIEVFIFLIMQFYTNHSLFLSLSHFYPDKAETFKHHKLKTHHSLGIFLYISVLSIIIQSLLLIGVEISLLILITSLFLHGLMILDAYQLKLLGKLLIYLKGISWLLFMFSSNFYLIWIYVSYLSYILISSIPPLILLLIIELIYLFKLFEFLPKLSSKKNKIRKRLLTVLYFDFIIWPLFFLGFNVILNITLFLISFYVLVIISYIDEKISHIFEEKFLKKLRFTSTLIILIILIVDIFSWLHFSFNLSLPLNICISLLIFSIFNIGLLKPFKRAPNFSFAYGGFISLLVSLIIYFATFQTLSSIILFPIMLTFYLFIFMLEVLKTFFNKLLDLLIHFFSRLKKFIKYIGVKIFNFLKLHYKIIWVSFSLFLAVSIGILLSPLQLNYLNWYHSVFVMLGLFGLLSLFLPSKKTEDVDLIFKHRMRKLITSWITVIAILFLFIDSVWYIIAFWISIWIMGIILLPYVIYKERKDNISVKWRFYTLIIILTAIILVGIPAIISILLEFNVI